jgi:hypothetical protein
MTSSTDIFQQILDAFAEGDLGLVYAILNDHLRDMTNSQRSDIQLLLNGA